MARLLEHDALTLLAQAGIPLPRWEVAAAALEAEAAAARLGGMVVLKALRWFPWGAVARRGGSARRPMLRRRVWWRRRCWPAAWGNSRYGACWSWNVWTSPRNSSSASPSTRRGQRHWIPGASADSPHAWPPPL
jgi:hypothetical protein